MAATPFAPFFTRLLVNQPTPTEQLVLFHGQEVRQALVRDSEPGLKL
jgi:hypothetical protein